MWETANIINVINIVLLASINGIAIYCLWGKDKRKIEDWKVKYRDITEYAKKLSPVEEARMHVHHLSHCYASLQFNDVETYDYIQLRLDYWVGELSKREQQEKLNTSTQ